ncbi:DNA binding protein [Neoconidiobolus thromboides FSU 785]|nr:DNA binding protein [Neoconidiobolus thromboides FSU 785]
MPEPSKINATKDTTIGTIKENVGWALGNEQMQAEGKAQHAKGDAEYKAAQAQGYAEGSKDSMKGSVKDTVGSAIGNEQMQAEGKADKLKGDAQKKNCGFNLMSVL